MSKYAAVQINKLFKHLSQKVDETSIPQSVLLFPTIYKLGLVFGNSCFISQRKVVKSWQLWEHNLIHLEFCSRISCNKESSTWLVITKNMGFVIKLTRLDELDPYSDCLWKARIQPNLYQVEIFKFSALKQLKCLFSSWYVQRNPVSVA